MWDEVAKTAHVFLWFVKNCEEFTMERWRRGWGTCGDDDDDGADAEWLGACLYYTCSKKKTTETPA